MNHAKLIEDYLAGPQKLRVAIAGMHPDQMDTQPIPDKWSTRQVVCHITDCEVVYADRMKRVLAEDNPLLLNLDPDAFAAALSYQQREVEEELQLIEATRQHIVRILRRWKGRAFNAPVSTRPLGHLRSKRCFSGLPNTFHITSSSLTKSERRWNRGTEARRFGRNIDRE